MPRLHRFDRSTAMVVSPVPPAVMTVKRRPRARAARGGWAVALLAVLTITGMQTASADPGAKPPANSTAARQAWIQVAGPSVLPVDVAAAAWSRQRSGTTVSLGACAGTHCINVELVDVSACDSEAAMGSAIGGCAVPGPDGSCTAQVKSWLVAYPDALRAALEHEVGHCLGLPHNTTDKRSIMAPSLNLTNPPSGPDGTDLSNLQHVDW